MNYSILYNLQAGDRIIEPLFETGISKHHAVYLGTDFYGNELIAENHKFKGVQIITAGEYFSFVKRIDRIEKFTGNNTERKQAIQRALQAAGRPYDLINYNCEHFASEVQTGKAESKQVSNVLGLIAIAVFTMLVIDL